MKHEFLIVCEKAFTTEISRNLNIIGIFDTIYAPGFPAQHPEFNIVSKLKVEDSKEYEAKVSIRKGSLNLAELTLPFIGAESNNLIFKFVNLNFPEAGEYTVVLNVNDKELGRTEIRLEKQG